MERKFQKIADTAAIYKEGRLVSSDAELVDLMVSMYPEAGRDAIVAALVQEGILRPSAAGAGGMAPVLEPPDIDEKALSDAILRLFDPIIGYEDVKDLFLRAIVAEKPVHILLEGPPASAKTLFLMELGTLPGAYFAVGGGTSRPGLTQALLMFLPTYFLVDEIETVQNPRDYSALLHLMENEEVVETKYGRHVRQPLTTWVFAAGNDVSRLPGALLSRFGGRPGVIRFKEYAPGEFVDVATNVLVKREGVDPAFAKEVADATLQVLGSKDVRMSVRLARLVRDSQGLGEVLETFRRYR